MSRFCEDCFAVTVSKVHGDREHDGPAVELCPKHAAADAMLEALKKAEWNGCDIDAQGKNPTCPVCGNFPEVGHALVCSLAAAIALASPPAEGDA